MTAFSCFAAGFFAVREMEGPLAADRASAASGPATTAAAASRSAKAGADAAAMASGERTRGWFGALDKRKKWNATGADDHAVVEALLRMTPDDFRASAPGMLAYLNKSDSFMNQRVRETADLWMDRWLELDAPGALECLESSSFLTKVHVEDMQGWPLESRMDCGIGGLYAALAVHAPEWLRTQLAGMKDGAAVQLGLFKLLRESAQRDSAQAAQILASMPDGERRKSALAGYVGGLAAVDARQALDVALKEPDGFSRQELLRMIFLRSGTYGLARTRELLTQIADPKDRLEQTIYAVPMLGQEGRENLFPFVQEETARLAAGGLSKDKFSSWASALLWAEGLGQDREYAEWALRVSEDKGRSLFGTAARHWAQFDAPGYLAWLGMNAGTLDPAAVDKTSDALRVAADSNLAAFRAWSDALPPGSLRDQARLQVALGSGKAGDVAQAVAAYQSVAAADTKGDVARQLARVLVEHDAEATANWAQSLPEGKARTQVLDMVTNRWSLQNPGAMAQWLEQQPAGADRDLLLKGFAPRVAMADAPGAAQWVEQIEDTATRTEAAQNVYDRWKIENPVAARQWLRQLGGVDAAAIRKALRNGR